MYVRLWNLNSFYNVSVTPDGDPFGISNFGEGYLNLKMDIRGDRYRTLRSLIMYFCNRSNIL